MDEIDAGFILRGRLIELRDKERFARREAEVALESPNADVRYAKLRAWKEAEDSKNRIQQAVGIKFADAVADALELYKISPVSRGDQITGGPIAGSDAPGWNPRVIDRPDNSSSIYREIEMPSNGAAPPKKIHPRWDQNTDPKKWDLALTWPDGRVDVLIEALERTKSDNNPNILGFVLYHESVHYDQLLNGTWSSRNRREKEAYEASQKAAARFGLTKKQRDWVDAKIAEHKEAIFREQLRLSLPEPMIPAPIEEARNADKWKELLAAKEMVDVTRAKLERSLAKETAARRVRDAVADQQNEEEASRKLKEWTALACQSSDWPSRPGFDLADVAEMFGRLRVPSRPIDLSGLPFGPMGCPTFLENQLLLRRFDAGGTLPADWLSETISTARQVGRSLANQEARTVLKSWLENECSGSGAPPTATCGTCPTTPGFPAPSS